MKNDSPDHLATSVHARLLNHARATHRSFNDLLQLYAMERFLYRLSQSPHSSQFVLKGALLLRVWDATLYRATRDIDLLGRTANDVATIVEIMQSICMQTVEPDGLKFDAATVTGETIVDDADYEGLRITFKGHLGNAKCVMQIDIGFGDEMTLAPDLAAFPTLLNMPAPHIACYAPETVVAEKFQIMLRRGEANSRMKDIHDLWWLARNRKFDGQTLNKAIKATCRRRETPIPQLPIALTQNFAGHPARITQWKAFRQRLTPTHSPEDFTTIIKKISKFLLPIARSAYRNHAFDRTWSPPGPWR